MSTSHAWWARSLLSLALALAGCSAQAPDPPIEASGRIEGDEVRIAAKIPGRIAALHVREGDAVEAGQVVAELATPELDAQGAQARAAVAAAQAALVQAETRVEVLDHHAGTAREDYRRAQALLEGGVISAQRVDAAEDRVEEVEGDLRASRARVEEARAALEERRAALAVVQASLEEGQLLAPRPGVVLHRLVEEGEVVAAGQPLLVAVDPARLYLRVFVSEAEIGRVRLGDGAVATIDAFPERRFAGTVVEVAEEAEFTPRDIHTPDERTRLVYGVKIRLDNRDGYLKPGMTADAVLATGPAAPP